MAQYASDERTKVLERMTEALETAKRAHAQGLNVKQAREALLLMRKAFEARDYQRAMELANRTIELCGSPRQS